MDHCRKDDSLPPEDIVSACTRFISESFQQGWNSQFIPLAMVDQAIAYEREGNDKKAEVVLRGAITRYPYYAPGWETLGELLEKVRGPGYLMDTLNVMVQTNRGSADAFNAVCWYLATKNLHLDQALAACNTSVNLDPKEPNALDSRALVNLRNGDYAHAIADAGAALAIDPKLAGSLYVRGLAKAKSGDAAGAAADIAAAKTIDPGVVQTYAEFGVAP